MLHYACDGCGLRLDREYRPRVYLLPDGREVAMPQRHVWCERCDTVTPAEALEPLPGALPITDEDAADLAAWRALRTRPARCLRCGEDIEVPPSDWEDLPHPPCGGTLRATATIIGGTFRPCRAHRYSVDGELLEQGVRFGMMSGQLDDPLELW